MKKYLYLIFMFAYMFDARAATKASGQTEALRTAWGITKAVTCQGKTEWPNGKCTKDDKEKKNAKDCSPQYAAMPYIELFVAREIVEHGGKFCKTYLGASRKDRISRPYTTYYEPSTPECYWFCEKGYFGTNCSETAPTACNKDFFTQTLKVDKVNTNLLNHIAKPGGMSGNIEDTIPMFFADSYVSCSSLSPAELNYSVMNGWKQQEHDIVLAIEKYGDQKISARPLQVRAGSVRNVTYIPKHAWPVAAWAGTAKMLCPDGWTVKADGTACEQVSTSVSNICKLESLCSATPANKFDSTIHKFETISSDSSLECAGNTAFRCKSGAFKATGDFSCIDCYAPHMGPDVNGFCQECSFGEIYNSDTKTCITATQLSKNVMKFGKGTDGNVNSASTDIDDQCWAKETPDEYKKCITPPPSGTGGTGSSTSDS